MYQETNLKDQASAGLESRAAERRRLTQHVEKLLGQSVLKGCPLEDGFHVLGRELGAYQEPHTVATGN